MPIAPPQTVFVLLTGAAPPPGLARAAMRNGWPIREASAAIPDEFIGRESSAVVIIHIPASEDLALDLIRRLRAARRASVIIAVSAAATEDSEVQARAAGAGLFLPASADADLIERTVQALIVPPRRAARAPVPPISATPRRSFAG